MRAWWVTARQCTLLAAGETEKEAIEEVKRLFKEERVWPIPTSFAVIRARVEEKLAHEIVREALDRAAHDSRA